MLEGLPPNGAACRLQVVCDASTARRVVDVVVETLEPSESAAAAFEDPSGGSWTVDIYFRRAEDESCIRSLLENAVDARITSKAVFSAVGKTDWVAASLAGLDAVQEGRFVVHGAHGRNRVRPGNIGIEIEAALAFGTGHHGTTRGCLAMLDAIARRRRPRRILDIGTGTGVLAIAAARHFRVEIAAGDVDPVAVATARANAIKNGTGMLVRPVLASGLNHPRLRRRLYDLVFANILARPLRALARPISQRLLPGGELVLSGLLLDDVPNVLSAYRARGLALVSRRDIEGWATLLMRRPVSSV